MTRDARFARPRRQRGAVAVVVALALVALLAVLGLVLDLGHLYIVKTELQNAADACALSAARELNDKSTGASDRAKAAGVTAGRRNKVDLQKVDVVLAAADVTFSAAITGPWSDTIDAATVYARCGAYEANPFSVVQWVKQMTEREPMRVSAYAIARPVGGKSYCAIPIAMCSSSGTTADFTKGQWYSGRLASGTATNGNYDWIRFEGQGAADLGEIVAGAGMCNLEADRVDAEPGVTGGVAQAWNTRFGLYAGSYNDIDKYPPDRTGYAFTRDRYDSKGKLVPGSWPNLVPPAPMPAASRPAANAYDGANPPVGTTYDASYTTRKNATHDPYDPRALLDDNGKPQVLPGNPAPLSRDLHGTKGQDRRMVFVPVIKCNEWAPNKKNMEVRDYACALMISPIKDPGVDVQLEYRGSWKAGECGTTGVPGEFGPPVPALVK